VAVQLLMMLRSYDDVRPSDDVSLTQVSCCSPGDQYVTLHTDGLDYAIVVFITSSLESTLCLKQGRHLNVMNDTFFDHSWLQSVLMFQRNFCSISTHT